MTVHIARVYDAGTEQGRTVLVDRLWPRGLARSKAPFESWMKEVAPSTELRKWYGHVPDRFAEFADTYRRELAGGQAEAAVAELRSMATGSDLTLFTATRDLDHSGAAVLRDVLEGN